MNFSTYPLCGFSSTSPLLIMSMAERFCVMFFSANSTIWIRMVLKMFFLRFAENQIFDSVIISNSVNMVYDFIFKKHPSNFLFHYKAMLKHPAVLMGRRMVGANNCDVSVRIFAPSSFESWTHLGIPLPKNVPAIAASLGRSFKLIFSGNRNSTITASCLLSKFHPEHCNCCN